jgi:hypothetical protein
LDRGSVSKYVIIIGKVGSAIFSIAALVVVVASIVNFSLLLLELSNAIPNAKASSEVNQELKTMFIKVELPIKNTGFMSSEVKVSATLLTVNGSTLATAQDSKLLQPKDYETLKLLMNINESSLMALYSNPEAARLLFELEIKTFFNLISIKLRMPFRAGGL